MSQGDEPLTEEELVVLDDPVAAARAVVSLRAQLDRGRQVNVAQQASVTRQDDRLRYLEERLAATKTMLAEVQWASSSYPEDSLCPVCSGEPASEGVEGPTGGHYPDCALAALL